VDAFFGQPCSRPSKTAKSGAAIWALMRTRPRPRSPGLFCNLSNSTWPRQHHQIGLSVSKPMKAHTARNLAPSATGRGRRFEAAYLPCLGWICCCCWTTGRTPLASWLLSASRSQTSAMWDRAARASRSLNVPAIARHCCARRRYSSPLLATTHARPSARSQIKPNSAAKSALL
jgi:hypothetical protein